MRGIGAATALRQFRVAGAVSFHRLCSQRLEKKDQLEKTMRLVSITVVSAILIGCASHTGVVSMGRDTYLIAKQQATGFPGLGNMKAEIIGEASRHCAGLGKELQIVSTQETQPPYILGNYPRSEITFMCLMAGDPELQRPKLTKTPDTVIEMRKP